LELAAREPDTTSPRLRTPDPNGSQGPGRRTSRPTRLRLPRIQPLSPRLDARLTPPWTYFPTTPGCRCLTAPAPLERSRIQGPGIAGLASPVELPLIEQLMTCQEARRRRPPQARPHDCSSCESSTSKDSRRLGREPKTNSKSLDPELDQRSTTDSIHRSLNTIHGTQPPQPSVMVSQTCGPGRRHSRHPVTHCCRRCTHSADRTTSSSASFHSHVRYSSSPSGSGDSDVTQTQAQARHTGGAAIKTHLGERTRRPAGRTQLERVATPSSHLNSRLNQRPDSVGSGRNPLSLQCPR
jgi:hypothetical protein